MPQMGELHIEINQKNTKESHANNTKVYLNEFSD